MLTHPELVRLAAGFLRDECQCVQVLTEPSHPVVDEQPDAIGWNLRGSCTVIEAKASLSDLRADRIKPFRRHADVLGMGTRRFYLFEGGGDVRPEHVDEAWGWGVLEVWPAGVHVARPAESWAFAHVHHVAEKLLLIQALSNATRAAGRDASECRKSEQRRIPLKLHHLIHEYVIAAGGTCRGSEIARVVIAQHLPRTKPGTIAKWLANEIRSGVIPGLTAHGTPAEISIS